MRLGVQGLLAATFTAMHTDGSLNLPRIEQQLGELVRIGVRGAFICGTTGEGQSLTTAERRAVAERWCALAGKEFPVIVHVGHASLAEAEALARHAAQMGASAIAAMPPYFYKPQKVQDVVACCARVAAAAPHLPFYYYHFPEMSGVTVPAAEFLAAAAQAIPNLAGIKFTDERLLDYGRCLTQFERTMDLFIGREEMLLGALATGARWFIGGTMSLAAPLYRRLIDAFDAGELSVARDCQANTREMIAVLRRFGGLRAMKAAMNLLGPDCGPVRLPLRTLDETERTALGRELEAVGFFDFTRPEAAPAR